MPAAVPKFRKPDQDCGKYTVKMVIKYDDTKNDLRDDLISALLRTLAVYTDGYCVDKDAVDTQIAEQTGLVLYFSSETVKAEFKRRLPLYVERTIFDRLKMT